jgi:hypothetical protein
VVKPHQLHAVAEGLTFPIDTFEPIDPPWPAIRDWNPADYTNPHAFFLEDIVSTRWVPKEIPLDDERLCEVPSSGSPFPTHRPKDRCKKTLGTAESAPMV